MTAKVTVALTIALLLLAFRPGKALAGGDITYQGPYGICKVFGGDITDSNNLFFYKRNMWVRLHMMIRFRDKASASKFCKDTGGCVNWRGSGLPASVSISFPGMNNPYQEHMTIFTFIDDDGDEVGRTGKFIEMRKSDLPPAVKDAFENEIRLHPGRADKLPY